MSELKLKTQHLFYAHRRLLFALFSSHPIQIHRAIGINAFTQYEIDFACDPDYRAKHYNTSAEKICVDAYNKRQVEYHEQELEIHADMLDFAYEAELRQKFHRNGRHHTAQTTKRYQMTPIVRNNHTTTSAPTLRKIRRNRQNKIAIDQAARKAAL